MHSFTQQVQINARYSNRNLYFLDKDQYEGRNEWEKNSEQDSVGRAAGKVGHDIGDTIKEDIRDIKRNYTFLGERSHLGPVLTLSQSLECSNLAVDALGKES